MKQEDEKFMGTLILASQHPRKSQSMINYLKCFLCKLSTLSVLGQKQLLGIGI